MRSSLWRLPGVRELAAVTLFGFTSYAVTLSSLPLWAVAGGAPDAAAGLVTTALLVATVAAQTLVPAVTRRFGLRRVLAVGLVALAAPTPLYLVSHELWWLVGVSTVRGVGFGVLTVLGAVLTGRVAPPERHGEAVGIYGLMVALPNLLGGPAGVALATADHFAWVTVLALAPLVALPWLRDRPDQNNKNDNDDGDVEGPAVPAGVRDTARIARLIAAPSTILLVVTFVGGGVVTFLPVERPDGPLAAVALFAFGVTTAASRWGAGTLVDRLGPRLLLPATLLVGAVGMVGLAAGLAMDTATDTATGANGLATGGAALVVVGIALFGVGYGAVQNVTLVVAFARTGPAASTTASAVWNGCYDAGTALGAFVVGLVAAGPGLAATFYGCAGAIVVLLPLSLDRRRR